MSKADDRAREPKPPRPAARGRRWTSFVAGESVDGEIVRALFEQGNPGHRLRVEHDSHTLLIHLSDEDGRGWTTLAVDRATRCFAVGQGRTQLATARDAYESLYGPG